MIHRSQLVILHILHIHNTPCERMRFRKCECASMRLLDSSGLGLMVDGLGRLVMGTPGLEADSWEKPTRNYSKWWIFHWQLGELQGTWKSNAYFLIEMSILTRKPGWRMFLGKRVHSQPHDWLPKRYRFTVFTSLPTNLPSIPYYDLLWLLAMFGSNMAQAGSHGP